MAHELDRILRAFAGRPWAIHQERGREIAEILALRHANGPRADHFNDAPPQPPEAQNERRGKVALLRLHGPLVPRASAVQDVSSPFASVEAFMGAFREAATAPDVSAIVIDVDSPGGMVDLIPEAAAMVRGARREGRPIHAVANTLTASAAFWIASQADTFHATPSATIGAIGVFALHKEISAALEMAGVKVTTIKAGPRKAEINSFEPLSDEARAALKAEVDDAYAAFVADVAAGRGVKESIVRADPEKVAAHFGGGRAFHAKRALALGMIDDIATIDEVIAMARAGNSTAMERERLALL